MWQDIKLGERQTTRLSPNLIPRQSLPLYGMWENVQEEGLNCMRWSDTLKCLKHVYDHTHMGTI